MSSFYRPSTKNSAKAASAKLTRAERDALEENNLNILRASIERTLWSLDPASPLAADLHNLQDKIRKHSLSTLLQEKKTLQVQEDSDDEDDDGDDDDNALPEPVFAQSSPLRRELPRSSTRRNSARMVTKLPERRRPAPAPREQILPSIEKTSSDQASEAITVASAVFDSPNKEQSATTAATSVMEAGEETKLPVFKTPAKKRAAEDEYDPSPVAKRVKTWLGTLTGGYME
ncbi:hypothetical protein HYE67_006570 [Fusarium culmorum]|uniref:Uncharacterized protein n=1 Tax=Fusarium culmorum TaxID=5516 RepID=A0A2T4H0R5_FUSCU|nr:hypothetical protein FCULG_00007576 [Fusarium culmorum]QPC64339.1 hypothetical protein HYE67_006570 [Fusarium culmorum]